MFKEFVETFNNSFPKNTGYYKHNNGLERWDSDEDFLDSLLYEKGYDILAERIINFDIDKNLIEKEIVFQAEGGKYFITITVACYGLQSSKIYPITGEKEIITTEYTIKTGQKKPITIKKQ